MSSSEAQPENAYVGAYPFMESRRAIWQEIADYVRRDAGDVESVVELGPGYCDFINAYSAKHKFAFDLNPDMSAFADDDVDLRIENALGLDNLAAGSIDLVFASNFFEHLEGDAVDELLSVISKTLRPGGRLMFCLLYTSDAADE